MTMFNLSIDRGLKACLEFVWARFFTFTSNSVKVLDVCEGSVQPHTPYSFVRMVCQTELSMVLHVIL